MRNNYKRFFIIIAETDPKTIFKLKNIAVNASYIEFINT